MVTRFATVDQLMRTAVSQRVFPGAVLWIACGGKVLHCEAYGLADLFSRRAMTCGTVFDLASLTKPLATTLAVMTLVHEGVLELDQPLGRYWADWSGEKQSITIRQLLCHQSGLPAWQPYYMRLRHLEPAVRLNRLRRWVMREPLLDTPGKTPLYSDLGFMLLQRLVEEAAGERLDGYVARTVYGPLGITSLFFVDLSRPALALPYAATELCAWRKKLLCGQVHDDNAYVLGGVAGHAGLFGTAGAVGALLQALLAPGAVHEAPAWLELAVLELFFQRQPGGTFALGFDTPSLVSSSSGDFFSEHSVGHLGFTGTSFWIDRHSGLIVVLLTNRVHPSRYNERLRDFRPRLHNTVVRALGMQVLTSTKVRRKNYLD